MLNKLSHWIFILAAAIVTMAFQGLTLTAEPVPAQAEVTRTDNSCLTCHEDLYQLHDTGSWYCMSEPHKDRCTDCHEGNPSAFTAANAHVAMLAHPQANDGAKCLECHSAEEAQALIAKFEFNQGFNTAIHEQPYTPAHSTPATFPNVSEVNPLRASAGWLVFGFLMFGIWLTLVLRP